MKVRSAWTRMFGGYHPHFAAQKAIEEFEEEIGIPVKNWLREQAGNGYPVRVMAERIGISYRVACRLMEHYGINATGSLRLVREDGTLSIRGMLHRDGHTSRTMEDRVYRRMKAGMSYKEALASAMTLAAGKSLKKFVEKRA